MKDEGSSENSEVWKILRVEIRGGTQIWKWRASAYRRTKIGGVRCKISSKKMGHFGVGTKKKKKKKNGGFFGVYSQKWGSFSVQKCNFKENLVNFLLKLPQNR